MTPTDKLITAASQAVAERDRALEEAARLLHPDPVGVVSDLLVQLWTTREDRDALSADLTAIRGMVCRPEVPIVEAVALGLSEYAPSVAVVDAAKAMRAADDLRNALDRVATAVGVESDSTGAIVADLVVDAIRRLSSDRDQMRVARKDAAEDLERLDAILSSAGIDTTGPASDVADRVAAALLRPALPADLRTYLETRRDRLQGGHGLSVAAEIAALNRWLALPTAEVTP